MLTLLQLALQCWVLEIIGTLPRKLGILDTCINIDYHLAVVLFTVQR